MQHAPGSKMKSKMKRVRSKTTSRPAPNGEGYTRWMTNQANRRFSVIEECLSKLVGDAARGTCTTIHHDIPCIDVICLYLAWREETCDARLAVRIR